MPDIPHPPLVFRLPMLRTAMACLGLLVAAWTVSGATIQVTPQNMGPAESVEIHLRRIDAEEPLRKALVPVGSMTDLEIAEGVWELTAGGAELWSPVIVVTPQSTVRLPVWRRATIYGRLRTEIPASAELRVSFDAAEARQGAETLNAAATCAVTGKRWTCMVPEARLDLQFGLAGFATEFRWNVAASAKATDIGVLDFTPGASVAGKIETLGHGVTLDELEVTLSVANASANDKVRRLKTAPNARGFFQFKGVPAGQYTLGASGSGLVTAARAVDVLAGLNAVLREPLIAAKPRRLSVDIMPILDVAGEPWLVELHAKSPTSASVELVTQGSAAADGRWFAAAVTPGAHLLYVRRKNGAVWKHEEFEMPADDLSLPLWIEGQRVRGRVTLGDRPIAAKVQFEGAEEFVADDEGRFEVVAAKLPADAATLLVTSDTPQISRFLRMKGVTAPDGATVFDVKLPNTTIIGQTLNPDGSPVPFALLNIRSPGGQRVEQPTSDAEGRFQIAGLDPGIHKIQAEDFKKSSAVIDVEATDSSTPTQVDIVLHAEVEERGQVMMGALRIPSADIYAHPRGVATSFVPKAKSDSNGRFVLFLPPGTETYDLVVVPPGFATVSGRVVRNEKQKIVHVETTQTGGALTILVPAADTATVRRDGGEFLVSWLSRTIGGSVERRDNADYVTLPNLEPGRYEVCFGGRCSAAFVPPLASATVSFLP